MPLVFAHGSFQFSFVAVLGRHALHFFFVLSEFSLIIFLLLFDGLSHASVRFTRRDFFVRGPSYLSVFKSVLFLVYTRE